MGFKVAIKKQNIQRSIYLKRWCLIRFSCFKADNRNILKTSSSSRSIRVVYATKGQ